MSFKYPDPPEYYKKFEEADGGLDPPNIDMIQDVCTEYFVFGMRRLFKEEIIRIDIADLKLTETPIKNYKEELKKLNYSLLAKMTEYFERAAKNENDKLDAILQDIHKLSVNFYFVLNTLKDGIKAKKDLIDMRERQQESFEDQTNYIRETLGDISSKLNTICSKFNGDAYME